MSIKRYNEKRDFSQTPEPAGKVSTRNDPRHLRFVIQKHQASHLHYDFRLEMEGLLKSWAVPKGPSLDPAEKRLAMHVEDHPMDYRLFEGIIPKGNYGAGTVMVWDEGTYFVDEGLDKAANEKALLAGLKKGKLTFYLCGHKLRGEFVLVKMQGKRMGENAWLLIKHDDEEADTRRDIREQDRSVLSQRAMSEIADAKDAVWGGDAQAANDPKRKLPDLAPKPIDWQEEALAAGGRKAAAPSGLLPQLATLVDEPFDRDDWFFEIKWDGYRALGLHLPGRKNGKHLVSRNDKSFDERYPDICRALASLPCPAIVDGEIVALDKHGRPDFNLMQNGGDQASEVLYQVFDLLWLDGVDLRMLALRARKKLLACLLEHVGDPLRYSDHVEGQGVAFFDLVSQQKLEGMIAKDANAAYQSGRRTRHWLKVKVEQRQEFLIAGYTRPRNTRSDIGSLLLAYHGKDGGLCFAGHVGSGLDEKMRRDLKHRLDKMARKTAPFDERIDTNELPTWVTPRLVCEVRFTEKTPDHHLRHPVFLGLREDKDPATVIWEREEPSEAAAQAAEAADMGVALDDDTASLATLRERATSPDPGGSASKPRSSKTAGDAGRARASEPAVRDSGAAAKKKSSTAKTKRPASHAKPHAPRNASPSR